MQKMIRILSLLLIALLLGCSPGLYRRMDSSTPRFGPIYIGMTRAEAECHLGCPLTTMRIGHEQYQGIYEYELERKVTDTVVTDIMDFATSGLGILIVSPLDRFQGTRHLITVVYEMEDDNAKNDRVAAIYDQAERSEKEKDKVKEE
jgi:hypothetical protein